MLPRDASVKSIETPWEGDWLGYKEQAETLKKLLARQEGPLVISVNAPFGMGKTFFAKNLQADLKQEGAQAIYFNAWEEDIFDTPLLSLVNTIKCHFEGENNEIIKKILKNLLLISTRMFIGASKGFLDASTFGASKIADKMINGAAKESLDKAGSLLEETLQEKKQKIIDFKKALTNLHEEFCIKDSSNSSELKKKIFIIIDEIDRCNPNYSLRLLEEIKHLFSVKGYIFIVMSNYNQLNSMAATIYGNTTFGAEGYMNKFFDIKLSLKYPNKKEFVKRALSHSEFIGASASPVRNYIYLFDYIATNSSISLRQIIDAVNIYRMLKTDHYLLFFLLLCASYNFSEFESKNFMYFINEFKIDNKHVMEFKGNTTLLHNILEIRAGLGDVSIGELKQKLPGNYSGLIDGHLNFIKSDSYRRNLNHFYAIANLLSGTN